MRTRNDVKPEEIPRDRSTSGSNYDSIVEQITYPLASRSAISKAKEAWGKVLKGEVERANFVLERRANFKSLVPSPEERGGETKAKEEKTN